MCIQAHNRAKVRIFYKKLKIISAELFDVSVNLADFPRDAYSLRTFAYAFVASDASVSLA